jgi:cytochrome b6-f complex iron-sulfur subunit
MDDRKLTRREFVKMGSVAAGAVAVGPTILSACGGKNKYPTVPMQDNRLVINLGDHPLLKQQNEGILFQVPNNHENIVVVHTKDGFVASGAMCPHKGCSVRWQKSEELLVCPCHKSAYTAEGKCVRGPGWGKAMPVEEFGKNLTRYNAVEEGDSVIVTALDG